MSVLARGGALILKLSALIPCKRTRVQLQGLCESYEDPSSRCATVIDNNGTHEGIDITDMLKISKPTQVRPFNSTGAFAITWNGVVLFVV